MEYTDQTQKLAALAHPGRLAVFRLIVRHAPQSVRPGDMAGALGLKPNTLSVYLGALCDSGLLEAERRGTAIYYRAALPAIGSLVDFLVADCCRGRPDLCAPLTADLFSREGTPAMPSRSYSVLFICTGNSARSIFAEALLRDEGKGRFEVHSAGTRPSSELNPFALEVLARNGHDTSGLRAKNVAEFQGDGAPTLDFVFTVCDRAANEECPPWPGQPVTAHWGMPDPVKAKGTTAEKAYAFAEVHARMRRRIATFAALPFESLDRISLQNRLDDIGKPENP